MIVLILSALVIGIGMAFFNLTPPGLINLEVSANYFIVSCWN